MLQGPSSKSRPVEELQPEKSWIRSRLSADIEYLVPGPPFNHIVSGASSGPTRASKNLDTMNQPQFSDDTFCASPEEKMLIISNIQISRVLLDRRVTKCGFCDPQLVLRKQRMRDKLV
jgi:hypothetical protein